MKNLLLTTAFAVTLISPAFAGEKTVTVPMPKSITIVCSDTVKPGTVVLSNPPKFSCQDYNLVKTMVGTGITIGPDVHVNRLASTLRRVIRQNQVVANRRVRQRERPLTEVLEPRESSVHMDNSWRDISDTSLDDFGKRFPGINRNRKFFVSDSQTCKGWVSVVRILNGECRNARVNVN